MIEEALEEEYWYVVMNLIASEEHLADSFVKTDDDLYINLMNMMRVMRQQITTKIVKKSSGDNVRNRDGAVWCTMKHMLAIKVHLIESSQKLMKMDRENDAKEILGYVTHIDEIFLNLKEILLGDVSE